MTDEDKPSLFNQATAIKALLAVCLSLGTMLVGTIAYVALPSIDAVRSLNQTVDKMLEREVLMAGLYEQRYKEAKAQELFYTQQFNQLITNVNEDGRKMSVLTVRVDGLDKRIDSLENRPMRLGRP